MLRESLQLAENAGDRHAAAITLTHLGRLHLLREERAAADSHPAASHAQCSDTRSGHTVGAAHWGEPGPCSALRSDTFLRGEPSSQGSGAASRGLIPRRLIEPCA